MIVAELVAILQKLPQYETITLPFPFPDRDNLTQHEPFVMHVRDGVFLAPQAIVEIYMKEFPEDIIS